MFDLNQKATIYNAGKNDGFGGFTYTRHVIDCRYAETAKKMTDANGQELMATSVIYSEDANLKLNSKVFFGETAATEPPTQARDVRMFKSNESFTGMRVGWLA